MHQLPAELGLIWMLLSIFEFLGDAGKKWDLVRGGIGPGSFHADEAWMNDFTQDRDYSSGNVT
jgi:hypothetical protein